MADFEPIIKRNKKSSLQSKAVDIKGSNSFGRNDDFKRPEPDASMKKIEKAKETSAKEDFRLKASKTQKTSPSTTLKINTLRPFLKETEGMSAGTFNDIVDMLLDNYVQTKLTTRQNEAFQAIFKSQYEML